MCTCEPSVSTTRLAVQFLSHRNVLHPSHAHGEANCSIIFMSSEFSRYSIEEMIRCLKRANSIDCSSGQHLYASTHKTRPIVQKAQLRTSIDRLEYKNAIANIITENAKAILSLIRATFFDAPYLT